ncbi:MAG: RNA polymerase sigma factor [Chloroflexota bacterium]|nr:RNA polymerase sigma factor [Chloroflexota bacterium]
MRTEDEQLSRAMADDLDGSFEQLVLTYQDRIFRFGFRLTGNPQDGEEIAQDAFVRAYQALAGYPSDRIRALALRAWLYQIALNVFRNRVRKRQVQQVSLDGAFPLEDQEKLPERIVEEAELCRELAALIATLPERYRAAVVLRHVEELSYTEMAKVLDQPVGTIKANVHRGLQRLRTALPEHKNVDRAPVARPSLGSVALRTTREVTR